MSKRASVDELFDNEQVQDAIRQAAGRVFRRYRAFITFDDLTQSAYLWVAQHPNRVSRELPKPEETGRQQWRCYMRLVRLFERVLEGVARTEKAAATGYKVEDEVFYEFELIEEMLWVIWDPEAEFNPPQPDHSMPGESDPAEGNNWVVLVEDMRRAWKLAEMDQRTRTALTMRYDGGMSITELSAALELSKEATLREVRKGLGAFARALHGVRPLYTDQDLRVESAESD